MSLVAYDASSDDESDFEEGGAPCAIIENSTVTAPAVPQPKLPASSGHISDDDDDFSPSHEESDKDSLNSISNLLPKPKNETNLAAILHNFAKPTFTALPTPKIVDNQMNIEEDDEFLHKKPNKEIIEKPIKNVENRKMPVKITVPSLKNFRDVDKEILEKAMNKTATSHTKNSGVSGLLSILPKAKSEQNFAKVKNSFQVENKNMTISSSVKPTIIAFVPDTVKHRRPATNTEDVDRLKPIKKKLPNQTNKASIERNKNYPSDESGDEENDAVSGDFFSFNTDQNLPEVSATEISTLVAKKAAKIVENTENYLSSTQAQKNNDATEEMEIDDQQEDFSRKRNYEKHQLNSEAMQALVGGSTKRRRQQQADIQVIDINSSQVLPNKDEWMRTALASSTTYQPTGVLVDEEPASGTRRKHQITYLAHKAKANEAELQAMWSANRQNRRATQSKYGF